MTTTLYLLAITGWLAAIVAFLAAERWRAIAAARERELDGWHRDYQARRLTGRET